jgi:hypothetical protein
MLSVLIHYWKDIYTGLTLAATSKANGSVDIFKLKILFYTICDTGFENITRYGYFYCQNQVLCSKIPHISIRKTKNKNTK